MRTHCVLLDLCSNPGVLLPRVLELVQQRLWRADGVRWQSPSEELSRARVSPRRWMPERQGPEDVQLTGVKMVSQDQTGRQDVLLLEAKETQETDVGGRRTRKHRSATVALNEGVINEMALETHFLSVVQCVQLAHQPVPALVLSRSAGGCSVYSRSTRETRAMAVAAGLDAAVRVRSGMTWCCCCCC